MHDVILNSKLNDLSVIMKSMAERMEQLEGEVKLLDAQVKTLNLLLEPMNGVQAQ